MARTPATSFSGDPSALEMREAVIRRFTARSVMLRYLAGAFLICLFVPLVGAYLHWDPAGNASNENRRLADVPKLPNSFQDAQKYSDRWMSFFRDHFGLRNTLIRGVALARVQGLGDDADGNVVVGKDGWLFLRPDGDRNFIAYRGLNPFSDDELTAWQDLLERRNAWLSQHHIPYIVVIPPDKQTIYPEYLPKEYQPLRQRGEYQSRLDQLLERLRQTHSSVRLLDLRPALLEAKKTDLVYHRTDTHWNDWGAFAGYSVMIRAARELLPQWHIVPQTLNDFRKGQVDAEVGDLARMTDMPDQYPDRGYALIRKIPFDIPSHLMDRFQSTVVDRHVPTEPKLVFYRDSFGIALVPMIGPHFGRVVYAFHYEMDPEMILKEKPDLVITEFIERNLYLSAPPTDPPELRNVVLH
jgi:hypothetical protein